MDKRVLSSSASGYIIIPKLTDSTYLLVIGFPKSEWPELGIRVNVKDTNVGFLLKSWDENGWNISNLQTTKPVMAEKQLEPKTEVKIISKGDEFARILAEVVNDPSIAETTVIKTIQEPLFIIEEDKTKLPILTGKEKKSVQQSAERKEDLIGKVQISKLKQDSTSEGLLITYLDILNDATDTVKVFMTVNKPEKVSENEKQVLQPVAAQKKNTAEINNSRFIDMELRNPNIKPDSGAVKEQDYIITEKKIGSTVKLNEKEETDLDTANTNKIMINSDCKKSATQNDFLELRKQMASEVTEKAMIKTANKQLVKTCFTTEQIKNLGVLFINEEERYKFFVAAFPFVSDSHNFGELEDQLTDNYFKTRLKAMISH